VQITIKNLKKIISETIADAWDRIDGLAGLSDNVPVPQDKVVEIVSWDDIESLVFDLANANTNDNYEVMSKKLETLLRSKGVPAEKVSEFLEDVEIVSNQAIDLMNTPENDPEYDEMSDEHMGGIDLIKTNFENMKREYP
jgi:hypothetical protein